jgi:hypothetical protein
MNNKKENGIALARMLIILVLIGLIIFIVWRGFDAANQQRNQQTNATTHPSKIQTDPNAGYVVIKEWGVRFKPANGLTGSEYFKPKIDVADSIFITTEELSRLEKRCGKDSDMIGPLGLLKRSREAKAEFGIVVATINGYTYQYRGSDAACSESKENEALEAKTRQLISESIKSLEAAQ